MIIKSIGTTDGREREISTCCCTQTMIFCVLNFDSCQTKLARALAGEAGAAFVSVGPSDVLSKYVGESEASIRNLFLKAARMAHDMDSKCAVLFFDEIDALGQSRGGGGGGTSSSRLSGAGRLATHADGGGGGAEGSSRKVLAELLIQMTRLNTKNGLMVHETTEEADDPQPADLSVDQAYEEDVDEGQDQEIIGVNTRDQLEDEENCSMATSENNSEVASMNEAEDNQSPTRCTRETTSVRVIVVAATNRPEDCDPA